MRQLLSFESTAKSLETQGDDDTPYVQDSDGNVYLKKDLLKEGIISEDDISNDDFDYEYVIEEETYYQHYRAFERPKKGKPYDPVLTWMKPPESRSN